MYKQLVFSNNHKLKKEKNTRIESMILSIFYLSFFLYGIINWLQLPSFLTYFIDILNAFVFLYMIFDKANRKVISKMKLQIIIIPIISFYIVSLISAGVNLVEPQLVLWATRNEFRYYPYILASIIYLKRYKNIINFLFVMQIVNLFITIYQYFFLGLQQDLLGGIFGTERGCNAYSNIFFCILLTLSINLFIKNKLSFFKMLFLVASCMLLSAMAEIKIIFAELIIIVIFSLLFSRINIRGFLVVGISLLSLIIGLYVFSSIFSDSMIYLLNIDEYFNAGYMVGGGYNISRLGLFSDINDLFFNNNIITNLIGLGFGNCEYSSFDILTSDFYRMYGSYDYTWFSAQKLFLECGYLGFISFSLVLTSYFIWITMEKRKFGDSLGLGAFGQVYCFLLFINFIYNNSLRTECGFFAYMGIILPFIYYKEKNESKKIQPVNHKK